jgi:hypothetical protein
MKDAIIIPGYKDSEGYWHSARSSCCGSWLVYFNTDVDAFIHWDGHESHDEQDIHCRVCNKICVPKQD